MYPPELVAPMKADLTEAGMTELLSPEAVDAALNESGTTLVVINSVCGCAAGAMRPGVKLALQHSKLPTHLTTAFAGVDREAVDRARGAADVPRASPRLSPAACASITRYNRFPRNLANLAKRRIC